MATDKPTTLQEAQQHLREGRPEKAIELLVPHVKRNPRDLRALTVLEEAYAASGNAAMAQAVAQRATAIEGMIGEATPDARERPEFPDRTESADRGSASSVKEPAEAIVSRIPLIVGVVAAFACIIIALFVGTQLGIIQGAHDTPAPRETQHYTPSASRDNSPRPQTTTVSPARSTARWQKVAQWSGNAIKSTPTFTVGSEWGVEWATQPDSEYGGYFGIFVYAADGSPEHLVANTTEAGHDISYYHKAGTYYLEVNSGQPWAVTVWEKR